MELLVWLLRRIGARTLLTMSLLWLAVASVVWQIASAIRGLDSAELLLMTTVGLVIGWSLAKSHLSERAAAISVLVVGVAVVLMRVGSLGGLLFAALRETIAFYAQWWTQQNAPDLAPFLFRLGELWLALGTLLARTRDWALAYLAGQNIFDPVALLMVWSIAFWLIAAWTAWGVRRRAQPLPAFVPLLIVLVVKLIYQNTYPLALLLSLIAMMALMALVSHQQREQRWQTQGFDFSEDIRLDLALVTGFIIVVIGGVAALTPSVSVQDVVRLAQRLAAPRVSNVPLPGGFGANPSAGASADEPSRFERVRVGGLPRQHLIGSGPELSQQIAMFVKTDDPPGDAPLHYYWRSLTYDRYTGRGWLTDRLETGSCKVFCVWGHCSRVLVVSSSSRSRSSRYLRRRSLFDVMGVIAQPHSKRIAVKASSGLRPSGLTTCIALERRLNSLFTRSIGLVVRKASQCSGGNASCASSASLSRSILAGSVAGVFGPRRLQLLERNACRVETLGVRDGVPRNLKRGLVSTRYERHYVSGFVPPAAQHLRVGERFEKRVAESGQAVHDAGADARAARAALLQVYEHRLPRSATVLVALDHGKHTFSACCVDAEHHQGRLDADRPAPYAEVGSVHVKGHPLALAERSREKCLRGGDDRVQRARHFLRRHADPEHRAAQLREHSRRETGEVQDRDVLLRCHVVAPVRGHHVAREATCAVTWNAQLHSAHALDAVCTRARIRFRLLLASSSRPRNNSISEAITRSSTSRTPARISVTTSCIANAGDCSHRFARATTSAMRTTMFMMASYTLFLVDMSGSPFEGSPGHKILYATVSTVPVVMPSCLAIFLLL